MIKMVRLIGLLLLVSMTVGFDEVRTGRGKGSISIHGSGGQYAEIRRGCDGSTISKEAVPFREYGFNAEWTFPSTLILGLAGELLDFETTYGDGRTVRAYVVSPRIGVDAEKVGLHFGFIISTEAFPEYDGTLAGIRLRIGRKEKGYLDLRFLDESPFVSNGYFRLGYGVEPEGEGRFWIGLSAAPYDKFGLLIRVAVALHPSFDLNAGVRLGESENVGESSLSIGMRYNILD